MHVYVKLVDLNFCVEQSLMLETAKDFKSFKTHVMRRLNMFPMGKRIPPLLVLFHGRVTSAICASVMTGIFRNFNGGNI